MAERQPPLLRPARDRPSACQAQQSAPAQRRGQRTRKTIVRLHDRHCHCSVVYELSRSGSRAAAIGQVCEALDGESETVPKNSYRSRCPADRHVRRQATGKPFARVPAAHRGTNESCCGREAIGSHARIAFVCVMRRAPTEAPRRSRKFRRTPLESARQRLRSIGDPTLYFITSFGRFRADETLLVAHC